MNESVLSFEEKKQTQLTFTYIEITGIY